MSMPWFRCYSETVGDRKINHIARRTGHAPALVVGVWVSLLCLANASPTRGELLLADDIPYTLDDLEGETGLAREVLAQLVDEFRAHAMVDGDNPIVITNWGKRQFVSDDVNERVRRYRQRQKSDSFLESHTHTESESFVSCNNNETLHSGDHPEEDTPRVSFGERFPDDVREVIQAITEGFGIRPPTGKRDIGVWIQSARSLREACGEFGLDIIRELAADYRQKIAAGEDPGYVVSRPSSLENVARARAGVRRTQAIHQPAIVFTDDGGLYV